ncbi:SGNH/GDSL hydrolase family protein [Maioricimonas rarisocia]|nr:SGNH/GDSL hydrolase family protein [Maioricimonas rarisocia]
MTLCLAMLYVSSTLPADLSAADAPLELRDGDRVVLLGGTLIEREQRFGFWETALTRAWPDRDVTFRNLGWSGDTVWSESRGIFDPPAKGYERMLEHVARLKPTVIIVGYGNAEAFAGADGLDRFIAQYGKLLDDLSGTGARFALLGPLPPQRLGSEHPGDGSYGEKVALYANAINELARQRQIPFIPLEMPETEEPLTNNGLHLNALGYHATAPQIVRGLAGAERAEQIKLPPPATPWPVEDHLSAEAREQLEDPADALRHAIIRKNRLYFHRWRPQNITYLFGFRKHEQGQNAPEVAQFEALVREVEGEIARRRSAVQP